VLIRCEKCSTLYELDDNLVPPQGAPVQCSKCQFVFKAYPAAPQPLAPEQDVAANEPAPEAEPADAPALAPEDDVVPESGVLAGISRPGTRSLPTPESPPGNSAPLRPPPSHGGAGGAASRPPVSSPGDQQFTADGRPIRKVPFPTAEPAPPGPRPVMVRRPATSGLASPLRWGVVVAVAVVLVLVAVLAWRAVRHRGSQDAQSRHPAGQSLLPQQGGSWGVLARK
jgi:predicted Zn finger-like uncharacterized protein